MVYLASCNHDEQGRLGWEGKSKAGDQTGSEVSIVPYNTWDPKVWKAVYRAKDPDVAWRIGQAGIQMCRNDHIGYDQSQRLTFHSELMKTGNIDKISVDCETDCSAGTCACTIVAGYSDFPKDLRTAYWDKYTMAYGKFEKLDDEVYTRSDKYLKTGDILLKDGHVVICVSDGELADQYSKIPLYVLKVTGFTPVYTQPKSGGILIKHPALGKDNLVDYCDETDDMYYVRIINKWGWIPKTKAERRDPLRTPQLGDRVQFYGGNLYRSCGGGGPVNVPPFIGTVRAVMGDQFKYPYLISAKAYEGWCSLEDIKKI